MGRFALMLLGALCLIGGQVQAHEFWVEPKSYQIKPGDLAQATFHVGEDFKGPTYSYIPGRSRRFDWSIGAEVQPVDALVGNNPAFQMEAPRNGLMVVAHETGESSLTYREAGKFEAFVAHKALGTGGITHPLPFKELYSRHAKALIAVGEGAGKDMTFGLLHEIVAFTNPYVDPLDDGMLVQVLYNGAPRPGAQLEVFEKGSDLKVEISLHQADEQGFVRVPVKSNHSYLLDSVVLEPREPLTNGGAVWFTAWASMTFAVP